MLKKLTKGLSLLLALCMLVSLFPVGALATNSEEEAPIVETAEDETPAPAEDEEEPSAGDDASEEGSDEEAAPGEGDVAEEPAAEEEPAVEEKSDAEETDGDEEGAEASIMTLALGTDYSVAARNTSSDPFYKIVHVDCGRKYFSPENIKKIIDNAAAAGFNQVELYLSDNQGFRFALDDMNVTTSTGKTYDLAPALGDGYTATDGKCPDGSGEYLTQSAMTDIISYATGKGVDIVPCINVPGHMGAILEVFTDFRYSGSKSSIDLENAEAVAFALAITEKYATYFESQGVKFYNLGADEITTLVSDYGNVPGYGSSLSPFVMVDYAVKYESGELTPSSFSTSKTIAFHCNYNSSADLGNTVIRDGNTYYRKLGTIKAVETADYEVYMITLTPTSDMKTKTVADDATEAKSYNYEGTEKVIWVDDEANLGDFADESLHYTSPSGNITYTVGGEPNVAGLEIYKNQCMLVTYYVRAKVTEDSLAVHYIDQTANQEFYSYNIAVKSGTLFNANIGLAEPWKGDLDNGSVTNLQDKTQTVSSDLSTMPAIGAQYRYSNYTCVSVTRSEDGKNVYLYYTFNNAKSFVVDFGLPLKITTADLEISGDWTSASVSGAQYGTATIGEGITYTPTETLKGVETLQLTLTGSTGSVTHQIYIYPATTVYYEENFIQTSGNVTVNGNRVELKDFVEGGKSQNTAQTATPTSEDDLYGYDAAYADDGARASNGTYVQSSKTGSTAAFSFTGTGVDIYTNNTQNTGTLMFRIVDSTGALYRLISVDTAMKNGTSDATTGQEVAGYNVSVVSLTGMPYGAYSVYISHVKSGSENREGGVQLDGFRVYGTLENQNHEVYKDDLEDNPTFIELRDQVLAGLSVTSDGDGQVNAALPEDTTVALTASSEKYKRDTVDDLLNNGPKNEIYLLKDMALTLKVTTNREVQIGLKALNANTSYTINNDAEKNITTSTDMFYTVPHKNTSGEQTITITNKGKGILAITKLKVCDDPNAALATLTEDDLQDAYEALGIIDPKPVDPDPVDPEPVYADAQLNITVTTGADRLTTGLTKNGVEGERITFTADEIQAAVEALTLPEGYVLGEQTYTDVTVVCGESDELTFQAEEQAEPDPEPTPDPEPDPDPTPSKPTIWDTVKKIVKKLFWWL